MQELLTKIDLAIKVLLGIASLVGVVYLVGRIVFLAGRWWAAWSKLVGSVEAIHRRMTEDQIARQLREKTIDDQFLNVRLAIQALQTWKSTLRFKVPETEPPMFKDEHP